MAFLVVLLTLALIALVILVVVAPLRRERHSEQAKDGVDLASASHQPRRAMAVSRIADLEAAREAKYREIRDAELDFRTGKLSREDYELIDADLRAEAIAILNDIEAGN
ncbi:MAG TPA: hypothetical protein VIH71_16630 [Solirubrobacteraceae bacterium]